MGGTGGSLGRVLRGLVHRGPATALLVLVAVVAAGAAAAAPAYEAAAKISVVASTFAAAPASATQLEVQQQSAAPKSPEVLATSVHHLLVARAGPSRAGRLFAPPVLSTETAVRVGSVPFPVASRTGVCAHLRLVSGRCPAAEGETVEAQVDLAGGPSAAAFRAAGLRVVGMYAEPDPDDPFWFGQYGTYFPEQSVQALLVTDATAARLAKSTTVVVDIGLATTRLTPSDLGAVERGYVAVAADPTLSAAGTSVTTTLRPTVAVVHRGWSSLAVPTVVATGSLLVLSWLLLFLVVTEDVETRGEEIALARLRGLPRSRVLAAGVAEPLIVLVLAVPVGTVLGWFVAHLLAGSLFGPGVPVGLPALSWGAAVLAVLGGVAAVLAASRRAFARAVLEAWRPTRRGGPGRGWVFDAVLVTAAAAGLVELEVSGAVSSSSSGVQVELVPALLGLAVAVVLSRLLPPLCRRAAVRTRRSGGLAAFLAVRHVGRRPGGTRSVMVLASAVAIALFGVAAWSVGVAARARVAAVTVGAPTVLTVSVPAGADLDRIVAGVDPGGRQAVGVSQYSNDGQTLLAVDPGRFAAVASWAPGTPVGVLAARLDPPASAPVVVDGDALRLHLTGKGLAQLGIYAYVTDSATPGAAPVQLLPGPGGTYAGALPACPCALDALALGGPPGPDDAVSGAVTLHGVDVHGAGGWHDAGSAAVQSWRDPSSDQSGVSVLRHDPASLVWTYATVAGGGAVITSTDRPDPLPAVAAAAVSPTPGVGIVSTGVDGLPLDVVPLAVASSVPGAAATGVVVDRTYALRASAGLDIGQQQVWLAADAGALVPRLRAAGLIVLDTRTTSALRTQLDRQGPGLATALLLFDSSVAAALAAVGAVVSLVAAARRRRYEYAALIAAGARRGLVWRSLALEQAIVLGYGVVVGVGAGIAGIALAVHRVPVLTVAPAAPALDLAPRAGPLAAAVGIAVVAVVFAAVVSAAALVRTVRPSALREGMA